MFTKGNIEMAKKLMIPKADIRKNDFGRISYVGGVLTTVVLIFIVVHWNLD